MIGMVLAAGVGRRLSPDTDTLPKALLPVDGQTTILDIATAEPRRGGPARRGGRGGARRGRRA